MSNDSINKNSIWKWVIKDNKDSNEVIQMIDEMIQKNVFGTRETNVWIKIPIDQGTIKEIGNRTYLIVNKVMFNNFSDEEKKLVLLNNQIQEQKQVITTLVNELVNMIKEENQRKIVQVLNLDIKDELNPQSSHLPEVKEDY
ncbi:hypothetical protein ENUP19_0341G0034 [Entamoeba nuttalli]|uniref:Uncharacterized protein n=2 Tax=Entamoeba nuttalli TaxID=412467 RepID=K2H2L9_ENTNP|nr:hypothetical protein ENU1_046030 [Entamoeba nuttalli P19]EKE41748.1 hypothetical protein ENU1_046030 [Entamoeba nuttalli P19]|eukprot:XP_008855919.1 hypothetical protein ENU1_046030 [Entamoeba nuttalli P19]